MGRGIPKKALQLKSSEALGYNQPLGVKEMPSKVLSPDYIWDREKRHTYKNLQDKKKKIGDAGL